MPGRLRLLFLRLRLNSTPTRGWKNFKHVRIARKFPGPRTHSEPSTPAPSPRQMLSPETYKRISAKDMTPLTGQ